MISVLLVAGGLVVTAMVQDRPAYRNPSLSPDERARDLFSRMTVPEKFWQLYMSPGSLDDTTHDYSNGSFGLQIRLPDERRADPRALVREHTAKINATQRYFVERTRLGIPIIPFEEALHGLMAPGAVMFPQAIGLAATWDTALANRVARAAARETRTRGIRQALSPVVNIATDVRWGRVEETYGEDPFLSTLFGDGFVRAFEREGIVATPKHFVANVGDGGRDSYPIDLSVRQLDELHFPPFESAVKNCDVAGAIFQHAAVVAECPVRLPVVEVKVAQVQQHAGVVRRNLEHAAVALDGEVGPHLAFRQRDGLDPQRAHEVRV
jgi:beta-glucosidase